MSENYHEEVRTKNILALRELLKELPPFLWDFFIGISQTKGSRTQMAYALDLRLFFEYLAGNEPAFKGKAAAALDMEDLKRVSAEHIERFIAYITMYRREDKPGGRYVHNHREGQSRKLAAIRTMFAYFYKRKHLPANPAELVDFPKLSQKAITRLEPDEVVKLLDEVESGDGLTPRQKKLHDAQKTRDLAIVTLLLGTGIRISECVGINLEHVDFGINGVKVRRKGGDEAVVYFGDEVEEALRAYLAVRKDITPLAGHEAALFLSGQRRRITDRAVELLVKKYAASVTPLKNISPHKLRSTFGTSLYRETGDIYLVADVLGHSDINTTRKHYAEMGDEQRRRAARVVRLRGED